MRRCVYSQRVPEVHREGRRARAPLPDGDRRSALGGRDRGDPQGTSQEVRGSSQGHDSRHDARRRVEALGALHHRSLPARQGDRRDRRGRCTRASRRAGAAAGSGRPQGGARGRERREGSCRPRPELRARRVAARQGARDSERHQAEAGRVGGASPDAPSGARRRGDLVHRQPVDGHPGHAPPGGGDRALAADGRRDASDRDRPGRGDQGNFEGDSAQPRGAQRSPPTNRLVRILRAHGRRKDRARTRPRQIPLRRRSRRSFAST